ncbi:MAG TPA: hypothetical protein VGB98_02610 [Pyrinomonadaceae bacterium]|jgi:hypothetical protein
MALLLLLERHPLWSRQNPDGGITYFYYYDEYTWVVAALALVWLVWFFVTRYLRARGRKRPPRRSDHGLLKRVVEVKRRLSAQYLSPGFSANIHAVGVGVLADGAYCIQVFVNDPDQELWVGAGAEGLPPVYGGVPLVLIRMGRTVFLSGAEPGAHESWERYAEGIRDRRDVIIGGISGANANLTGQSGTLGYFCTRRGKWRPGTEIHMISNLHVLADLGKTEVDDSDLIVQPSPGESESNRPIGMLVKYSPVKFDGDMDSPNHIDAAIAKLWVSSPHAPLIPLIGRLRGHVDKKDVRPREPVRKFGRTTGYTEGRIFSIYLDIWVRYDRTGQSAFFQDQFLIAPALPRFRMFVDKGDSGSMVVDEGQYALGLIFAGVPEVPASAKASPNAAGGAGDGSSDDELRVENYGVANPISEVLDRLKIQLIT